MCFIDGPLQMHCYCFCTSRFQIQYWMTGSNEKQFEPEVGMFIYKKKNVQLFCWPCAYDMGAVGAIFDVSSISASGPFG